MSFRARMITLFAALFVAAGSGLLVSAPAQAAPAPAQAQAAELPPAATACVSGHQVFTPRLSDGQWIAGASATNCATKVYAQVCAVLFIQYVTPRGIGWTPLASSCGREMSTYHSVTVFARYRCYPGLFVTEGRFKRANGTWFYVRSGAATLGRC
jgi:hypothetical protein